MHELHSIVRRLVSSFVVAFLALGFGCKGPSGPPAGTERGPCYPNGTCNDGLVCLSGICVDPGNTDAGVDGGPDPDGALPDAVALDGGTSSNGTPCGLGDECTSGHCVDGYCCNDVCMGSCRSCAISGSLGTCTDYPDNTDPEDECGLCRVCSGSGSCRDATAGTDPKGLCTESDPGTCGQDGECNGTGACRLWPVGTVCAAPSCSGNTFFLVDECNGTGTCVDGGSVSCEPYACNNAGTDCRTNCTGGSHCTPGHDCMGGLCVSSIVLTWVAIVGGTYDMGDASISSATPVHSVTVPSFELTQTEVTVTQYAACVTAGSCTAPGTWTNCNWNAPGYEDHPVNCVSWHQAVAYCVWAGGRLPTESEWEYAARSRGQSIDYPWGNEAATCSYAVMYEGGNGCGTDRTWAVCSKPAGNSAQGLCDMAGNLWEWVEDDWHSGYTSAPSDGTAWIDDPRGSDRVRRGGGFGNVAGYLRAATRTYYNQSDGYSGLGLRCARSAP